MSRATSARFSKACRARSSVRGRSSSLRCTVTGALSRCSRWRAMSSVCSRRPRPSTRPRGGRTSSRCPCLRRAMAGAAALLARASRSSGARLPILAVALFAAGSAWHASAGGEYTRGNLILWMLAVSSWCAAWWPPSALHRERPVGPPRPSSVAWAALAAVVVAGTFFRLHRLSEVPAEPTSDHAEKLLDIEVIRAGIHPVFFPRNTGREPAQFYVTTWLADLLDRAPSFEVLKLGTALIGVLAVPLVFLLAREIAGTVAGLIASALFAVSQWPVGVTRTGLRHGYGVAFAALALWLAFRYLRTRDRRDALACGIALGAGVHGYTPFRIVPMLVLALVALALAVDLRGSPRARAAEMLRGGIALLGATVVAVIPLARYAVDRPDLVFERTSTRVEFGGGALVTFA